MLQALQKENFSRFYRYTAKPSKSSKPSGAKGSFCKAGNCGNSGKAWKEYKGGCYPLVLAVFRPSPEFVYSMPGKHFFLGPCKCFCLFFSVNDKQKPQKASLKEKKEAWRQRGNKRAWNGHCWKIDFYVRGCILLLCLLSCSFHLCHLFKIPYPLDRWSFLPFTKTILKAVILPFRPEKIERLWGAWFRACFLFFGKKEKKNGWGRNCAPWLSALWFFRVLCDHFGHSALCTDLHQFHHEHISSLVITVYNCFL